jgi:hypothetical protein
MAVTLLNVGDHLSLEFETSDIDAVQACIRRQHSGWNVRCAGVYDTIRFGGEAFTYQNEWDDPCLLSSSAQGDEILRRLHVELAEASQASQ